MNPTHAIGKIGAAQNNFLLTDEFDLDLLQVDEPPLNDMAEARFVLAMQRRRTTLEILQIKEQADNPLPLFWKCAGIVEASHPKEALRIRKAVADTEYVVTTFKRRFDRLRPSIVLPDIHTVVPVPPYASYPSGHATQSMVIARLMSELAPEKSQRLANLAMQVGRNREIAGLHYPSDTDAGFKLGRALSDIFILS